MTAWIIALLTALAFGWLARRAGRSWVGWAVGGGLHGLVTSILVMGLMDAPFIPYSIADQQSHDLRSVALAVLVVAVIGWLATTDLHKHYRLFGALWTRPATKPTKQPPPPARSAAKSQ